MANNPVASILKDYSTLVIDGALATELERRGCDLKDDLWSARILLEQPEIIKHVHLDYFRAGADCAITASGVRRNSANWPSARAMTPNG